VGGGRGGWGVVSVIREGELRMGQVWRLGDKGERRGGGGEGGGENVGV